MIKNIQLKIVLIFFILGMFIIIGLGLFFTNSLEAINTVLNTAQITDVIVEEINNIKTVSMISLVLLGAISIIVGIFLSKTVVKPIDKLIKNAEKLTSKEKNAHVKNKNEIDNLADTFEEMTTKLQTNLSEISTQKKQMETILLHMSDGIIAFNMEGKVILINPAATRALSIMEEDTDFETIFKNVNIEINMEKIIYLEDWTSSEQKVKVKDRYLNLAFEILKDEKDRPAGVMVLIQDITEHVKLDNMRKEFVADVSHELKTPITSIMGYADTLLETDHDKVIETKFLGVISSEAKRMSKLVTDLLSLSRFDSNKTNIVKEEFDLGELAKKCQEKLQIEIDKKHLQVHCLVTANVPPVYAEKDGIERVIINILSNSIKYTNENGTINIYVGFVYNDAYIKFIDTGIGIPEEDLERIFERFYRVDKARTREMGGTGLGLSIAKEILDRNNGTIDIKSKLNEGTEVVIRIPTKTNNKFILKEEENLNEGKARQQSNIQEQKDN
ncbi:signal transduction histidine kinase [Clostridium sp. CAG:354]|jgi:two-component system sensor histidine kinase VicK|nr:HAMP domain-containing protein [Clostridium sp.]MEE0268644.1 ATP-binding protein [Clostridia bacterium]CDE10908.1 signal transduction histidine kinase [Clostridium sp. CAG:354]